MARAPAPARAGPDRSKRGTSSARGRAGRRAPSRRDTGGRRYAVVYDIEGPRVRLGVLWFVIVIAAVLLGRWSTALAYGVTAVAAAGQTARCWRSRRAHADATVAAVGAGAVVGLAAAGPVATGSGVVALVPVALIASARGRRAVSRMLAGAGMTLQSSLFAGLAAASVVLLHDLEPGAAFSLVLMVSAYESGDYLVGTGAANRFEGPLAGMIAVLVVAFGISALEVPPFDGFAVGMLHGGIVALLAPAGQLAASAVLPSADSRSPALRRLDSLLLAGPVWYATVGQFLV